MAEHRCDARVWHGVTAAMVILVFSRAILVPCCAQNTSGESFVVLQSQFHDRGEDDMGEARLLLKNTGRARLSMAQLRIQMSSESPGASPPDRAEERLLFARLLPPVLQPGQYGQVVAKLWDPLPKGRSCVCALSSADGSTSYTTALAEPVLWISYVAFSTDRQTVCVYVRNNGGDPVEARLLRVGQSDVGNHARAIHSPIPPGDKGCLVYDLPFPATTGEFVEVLVGTGKEGREVAAHAVVRAIDTVPVAREDGTHDAHLALDVQIPFLQTMSCPAHAHGSHDMAAAKFLEGYVQRYAQDPRQIIRMHICRANMPRAWFRFGSLPDVATMNPYLLVTPYYDRDSDEWFCPFFYVGGVLGIVTLINKTGLGDFFGSRLIDLMGLQPGHEIRNFLSLCIVSTALSPLTTPPGVIAIMAPLSAKISTVTEFPLMTVLMTQVIGFSNVILPYHVPPIVVGLQVGGVSARDAAPLTLSLCAVTTFILIPINYLWWHGLGVFGH